MARDNKGSHHTVLPATHTFIHNWNEAHLPLRPSRAAELTGLWSVLIFRPSEGRRLIWPEVNMVLCVRKTFFILKAVQKLQKSNAFSRVMDHTATFLRITVHI